MLALPAPTTQSSYFELLPYELILYILCFLNFPDVARAGLTYKLLKSVSEDDTIWQQSF